MPRRGRRFPRAPLHRPPLGQHCSCDRPKHGGVVAADQQFTVNAASTLAEVITITDDATVATIKNKKDLRIRIPSTLNMQWDTSVTTVTVGGFAATKIKAKLKKYEDGGRTAVVDVGTDFLPSDQVTISGLKLWYFGAPSAAPDSLELEVNKDDVVTAVDDKS